MLATVGVVGILLPIPLVSATSVFGVDDAAVVVTGALDVGEILEIQIETSQLIYMFS